MIKKTMLKAKNRYKVISLFLLLCVCFSFAGCNNKSENDTSAVRHAEEVFEEIAVDYGTYGAKADHDFCFHLRFSFLWGK